MRSARSGAAIAVNRFGVNEQRSIAGQILVSRTDAKMPKLRRGQAVRELPQAARFLRALPGKFCGPRCRRWPSMADRRRRDDYSRAASLHIREQRTLLLRCRDADRCAANDRARVAVAPAYERIFHLGAMAAVEEAEFIDSRMLHGALTPPAPRTRQDKCPARNATYCARNRAAPAYRNAHSRG